VRNLAILVALGITACAVEPQKVGQNQETQQDQAQADSFDQERLANLAVTSCRCQQAHPESQADCWLEFDNQMKQLNANEFGIPCAPVSSYGFSIETADGEMFITTKYLVVSDQTKTLCTTEEAASFETLAKIYDHTSEGDQKAYSEVLAGKRVESRESSCVG
jgi:hypothetical protein